jgi:two-component system, NtrC family, sensor kinase
MNLFHLKSFKSIRSRLMVILITVLVPICTIGGVALNTFIKTNIEHSIETQLNDTNSSILSMVKASISLSIKNRLRAIAEKNKEIVEGIWKLHKEENIIN